MSSDDVLQVPDRHLAAANAQDPAGVPATLVADCEGSAPRARSRATSRKARRSSVGGRSA
jgi:hypothetical protein